MKIHKARTKEEISSCLSVMRELRPHLDSKSFLEAVERMTAEGFRLIYLKDPDIRVVAGYRVIELLSTGRILYVDDLITTTPHRSKGYGRNLLTGMWNEAKRRNCQYLVLDSGAERVGAHKFYETNGMQKVALHFSVPVTAEKMWSAAANHSDSNGRDPVASTKARA